LTGKIGVTYNFFNRVVLKMKKRNICSFCLCVFFFILMSFPAAGQISILKLKVVTEQANIRAEPDIGSIIMRQVPKGTILDSTGKDEEWFRVQLKENGGYVLGYVHESLVIEVEEVITRQADIRPVRQEPVVEKQPDVKEPLTEEPQPVEQTEEAIIPDPPPQELETRVFSPLYPSFEIFLYGGGSYVLVEDLNDGAAGLADFYRDFLGIQGNGEVSPLNIGYFFGGELLFPLGSHFAFGVGVDYLQGEKESTVNFSGAGVSETYKTKPAIKALPVRAVIRYSPVPWIYTKLGVEYYFAECSYLYRFEEPDSWREWMGNARGQGIGFIGSIGLDLKVSPSISLIFESMGRYAKISGFKGTDNYTESSGYEYTENGFMYRYQGMISEQISYPLVFIREKVPTEPGVIDPVEATLDFTGVTLRLGLLFKF